MLNVLSVTESYSIVTKNCEHTHFIKYGNINISSLLYYFYIWLEYKIGPVFSFVQLRNSEQHHDYLQQDGAIAHTLGDIIAFPYEFFNDKLISLHMQIEFHRGHLV